MVARSTEELNARKGKRYYKSWEERHRALESVRVVNLVIPE